MGQEHSTLGSVCILWAHALDVCINSFLRWGADVWLHPVELYGIVDGKAIEIDKLTGRVNLSLQNCLRLNEASQIISQLEWE